MLKKIYISLFALFILIFVGCGSSTKELRPIQESRYTLSSDKEMLSIIQHSLKQRHFDILGFNSKKIIAKYNWKDYMLKISIPYSKSGYAINYADSKNLKYDGTKIHKSYYSIVYKLKKTINKSILRYAKQKNKKIKIKPKKKIKQRPDVLLVRKRFGNATYEFKKAKKQNINSYALVFGISKYKQNPSVIYADNSARAFAELVHLTFGVPKENIMLLINDMASSGELKAKIEILKKLADENGNLYFYYAGHGVPSKKGDAYILPYDMSADSMYLEPNLRLKNIYAKLTSTKAKNVFMFIDSCFSGKDDRGKLLYKGVAPIIKSKKIKIKKKKITILTADKATDFANEYKAKKQRLFTYYLVDELSKGDVKLNEAYLHVKNKVKHTSIKKG